jgi:hypothetical protein
MSPSQKLAQQRAAKLAMTAPLLPVGDIIGKAEVSVALDPDYELAVRAIQVCQLAPAGGL